MSDSTDPTAATDRRLPMILGAIAGVLLIAVIIALTVYLQRPTGAAPAASPTTAPSSDTAAAPTPTPSATETAEAASRLELSGTGFTLRTEDGTEFTHVWADEAAPAVAALTDFFGTAPEEDFVNGDSERWAYDVYVWDGFRFYDVFLSPGSKPRDQIPAPTYAAITGAAGDDVELVDEFGITVGDTLDTVRALGPISETTSPEGAVRLIFGADRGTFYTDGAREFRAFVDADPSGSEVAAITYSFSAPLG